MQKFWAKIDKNGPVHAALGTRCWPWLGPVDGDGFGLFELDGVLTRVHRVAWALTHGDPGVLHVFHHCGNTKCCNPAHLYTGRVERRPKNGPRGTNGGRRAGAPEKKTPPTTVRLTKENHGFVRSHSEVHPDGQSGVINDAVAHYREKVEKRGEKLYATITGANGHGPKNT